jgi:hypothetical protein
MFQTTEMKNVQLVIICEILCITNTFIPVRLLLNLLRKENFSEEEASLFRRGNEKEQTVEESTVKEAHAPPTLFSLRPPRKIHYCTKSRPDVAKIGKLRSGYSTTI